MAILKELTSKMCLMYVFHICVGSDFVDVGLSKGLPHMAVSNKRYEKFGNVLQTHKMFTRTFIYYDRHTNNLLLH